MLCCQNYSFGQNKPHVHTERFASTGCWYALGERSLSNDFKQKINTGGIFISWWQCQVLGLTGFFYSGNTDRELLHHDFLLLFMAREKAYTSSS